MKPYLKSITLLAVMLLTITATKAQNATDTVSLVVSGQGATLEEARTNALRSAIEQAYGAFISTKTELLNDSLVKDEVVSVASGNIRNYIIVSENAAQNGLYTSTLRALVSISALETFCNNKGIVSEFKGGLFARNIKLQRLNEDNEVKSLNHLATAVKQMTSDLWSYKLKVMDPILDENTQNTWIINCLVEITPTKNLSVINYYIYKTLMELSMHQKEIEKYKSMNIPNYQLILVKPNTSDSGSGKMVRITWKSLYAQVDDGGYDAYEDKRTIIDTTSKENEKQGEVIYLRNKKSLAILQDLSDYLNYSIGNFILSDNIDSINIVETYKDNRKLKCKINYNWYFNSGYNPWEFRGYYSGEYHANYLWNKDAISHHYNEKKKYIAVLKKEINMINMQQEKDRADEESLVRYNKYVKITEEELGYFYDSLTCYCKPSGVNVGWAHPGYDIYHQGAVGIESPLLINLNIYNCPIALINIVKFVSEKHLANIEDIRIIPVNIIDKVK